MALKKVTGLWIKTNDKGEPYMVINLGLLGRHVLILRRGEWDLKFVGGEEPMTIGTIPVRISANGQRYMALLLGDAGKFVLFENNKLSDNSPDWTMNREVGDVSKPDNTPVTATSIPY